MRKLVETTLNYDLGNKKEIFEFFLRNEVRVNVNDDNTKSIKASEKGYFMSMIKPTVFRKSLLTDTLFKGAKGYDVVRNEENKIVELIIK